jgi:hypothetical protein
MLACERARAGQDLERRAAHPDSPTVTDDTFDGLLKAVRSPVTMVDVVIDNSSFASPRIVRG